MIQSDTLFLVDLFEIFRNMYIEIYEPDLWTAGFAWQAVSKKNEIKIRSLNWYGYVINGTKTNKRKNMSLYL